LQRLRLADETQSGTWAVHADTEKTLRALGSSLPRRCAAAVCLGRLGGNVPRLS